MTRVPESAIAVTTSSAQSPRRQASRERRIRGDLRFLRLYVYTVDRVRRYPPHKVALAASEAPGEVADRVEEALAGEAGRYRAMGWCVLALLASLPLVAAFLWSGMFWLPISIYWWPFERGAYGLPFFSLYEWMSYLALAAYFVVNAGLLYTSHDVTGQLGTEYRRLLVATPEQAMAYAAAFTDGAHPRAAYVLGASRVFSEYASFIGREDRS